MMKLRPIVVLTVAIGGAQAPAPAEPLSAERPGFSSGPASLAPGYFQLEGGYEFATDDEGVDVDVQTLPFALARWGLGKNTELQLGWAGYTRVEAAGRSQSGITDASIGIKHRVIAGPGSPFALAVYGALSIPVGDEAFSSDDADPTVGAFWTWTPAQGPGLFGTVLVSSVDSAHGRNEEFANAVGASWSLNATTGVFVEYFGFYAQHTGPAHHLDGGVTWLFGEDVQLDINGGVGLNDAAGDFFFGFGAAKRW